MCLRVRNLEHFSLERLKKNFSHIFSEKVAVPAMLVCLFHSLTISKSEKRDAAK